MLWQKSDLLTVNFITMHDIKRKNKRIDGKLIGRGGKRGKTSGRGGKGQTARSGSKIRPELRDWIRKLPKLRGRGKNTNMPIFEIRAEVNLGNISKVASKGDLVNPAYLVKKGLIERVSGKIPPVKILSFGSIDKAINVRGCTLSASAKEMIEKAGGSVKV